VYEIAQQVQDWLAQGRDVTVATVVATRGFSSREPGSAAAWTAGEEPVGRLIEGVSPADVEGLGLVEVTISEHDAVAAGLACGGTASVLVQPATAYPVELWARLLAREPLCMVTTVQGVDGSATQLFTPATIREFQYSDQIPRLFGRGVSTTAILEAEPTTVAVALWPVPKLVVVGDGLIAEALRDTAALLGWPASVTPAVDDAVVAIESLHRSDAVVVLSHDRAVDGPSLAAAVGGPVGYVGALGSRRTQAARRQWLSEHGVTADAQGRIHGPAGLDIDAHTPGEIAISIMAEILGSRAASSGGALRDREGPVHVAGVQAPPPRY
jgi:xanthine dehydrogenase accessory factor